MIFGNYSPMVDLKVIVTGTGRCGTLFMANVLTTLGWNCGHEAIFGPGGLKRARSVLSGSEEPLNSPISREGHILCDCGGLVADSSYMAAPFLREFDTTVIHLVRNPIPVVASLVGAVFRNFSRAEPTDFEDMPDHILYERFIYEHTPELRQDMPQLDRGCLFYLRWNEMIEGSGRVDIRHRVEDPPDRIQKLLGCGDECYSDSSCNSFAHSSRMWSTSQIDSPSIKREMKDIMRRYGYKEPPAAI